MEYWIFDRTIIQFFGFGNIIFGDDEMLVGVPHGLLQIGFLGVLRVQRRKGLLGGQKCGLEIK
jgi:hypothetical protein